MGVAHWHGSFAAATSNDTELEKLEKRLQFVMYCMDCFVQVHDSLREGEHMGVAQR
jgi:hypothetical protein